MSVVKFDVDKFRELYPEIKLSDAQLEFCFKKAELRLNNSKKSMVCDLSEREVLLYLLTAHLAAIQDRINDGNDAVGRIASSSEGSVSVSLDFPTNGSASLAWFSQTPYGVEYWELTKKYRTMRYIRSPFPTMRVNRYNRW